MTEAERITRALLGSWFAKYGLACCPAHGDRNPSLSIANGEGGRLLLRCHSGCDFEAIIDALRGLGIIEGHGTIPHTDPAEMARYEAAKTYDAAKRERQARRCWDEALCIRGTVAETYLQGRSITADLPAALRFHPECWHGPTAKRLPAMVALIEGGERLAVHRTYLHPDGSGKAGIEPNKMMLGAVAGGAVRLVEAEGPLVVAEGIETALSLASGLLRHPATIWAALSTSGMSGLHLPERPHRLTIATDGDDPGRTAGHKLAERADALGWTVSLLPAPQGRDWNDILQMKGAVQ